MNEKSLEVLNQYDVKIMGCVRGRGGILVSTDKGEKLLMECSKRVCKKIIGVLRILWSLSMKSLVTK